MYVKEKKKICAQVSGHKQVGENEQRQVELTYSVRSRCGVPDVS